MAENVNKQKGLSSHCLLVGLEPSRNLAQNVLVVFQVLKHFYRHYTVKPGARILENQSQRPRSSEGELTFGCLQSRTH